MKSNSFDTVLRKRLIIEMTVVSEFSEILRNISLLEKYLIELSILARMTVVYGPLVHDWAEQIDPDKYAGLEGLMVWAESGVQIYTWGKYNAATIDIYSCKEFSCEEIVKFSQDFFHAERIAWKEVEPLLVLEEKPLENEFVIVKGHPRYGKGTFAKHDISKGTVMASFDGEILFAKTALDLPAYSVNHSPQIGEYFYKEAPLARYTNHSCNPNTGIKGLTDLVAMQDLKAGDEILWDYAMTEDSNWEVPGGVCTCGSANCRGTILPYRKLPYEDKARYWDFTSDWLKEKYGTPKKD